jgi:hypothetical protein
VVIRLFSVHVLDFVRRRVADEVPDVRADEGLVVRRVDGGDLVEASVRVATHPLALSLGKVRTLDRLLRAR